jgi:hypothetical protein
VGDRFSVIVGNGDADLLLVADTCGVRDRVSDRGLVRDRVGVGDRDTDALRVAGTHVGYGVGVAQPAQAAGVGSAQVPPNVQLEAVANDGSAALFAAVKQSFENATVLAYDPAAITATAPAPKNAHSLTSTLAVVGRTRMAAPLAPLTSKREPVIFVFAY